MDNVEGLDLCACITMTPQDFILPTVYSEALPSDLDDTKDMTQTKLALESRRVIDCAG